MAAVKRHEVSKAIIVAMRDDATVKSILGDPPRLFTRVPRTASTFPFARMTYIASTPTTGVMTGSNIDWARSVRVQIDVFSKEASEEEVSNAQAAISDVMDNAPTNLSITNFKVFMSIPGAEFTVWEDQSGVWRSISEWTLSISAA